MTRRIVASILHGAYGDYYEQAICLKHFKLTHPEVRLRLFAASPHRLAEFQVLDLGFAECFSLWTELQNEEVHEFVQFQVQDRELRADVIDKLRDSVKLKIDLKRNLLPWRCLRSLLPLPPELQLGLSEFGRSRLPQVMAANGISEQMFQRPTVGFLWRYRGPTSAGACRSSKNPPRCWSRNTPACCGGPSRSLRAPCWSAA